jgi:prepilin signal peptidase PulO-like enzyme (type II secretory pathway)
MIMNIPLFPDALWIRFAAGFIIGAVLGSFATVLAYRLPRRLSIVSPRSHCLSCNTVLGVRDLIPILSWLSTRGYCRHCNAKIGIESFIIELVTSLACAAATVVFGLPLCIWGLSGLWF